MSAGADPADDYVRSVIDAYRRTPGTIGRVRPADRRLARTLHARGIGLQTVLDALLLATVRRYARATPASMPALARSLAYFEPLVGELLADPLDAGYRRYLLLRLDRCFASLGITR